MFTCTQAQAAIQPHYGGLIDYAWPWANIPCAQQRIFNLQMLVIKELRPVEDPRVPWWRRTPSLITRRKRMIGGPRFVKMGATSWHIQTLPQPKALYIWTRLSLFTLEYGGQAVYMETQPKLTLFRTHLNLKVSNPIIDKWQTKQKKKH